ncbi:hypothetical protein BB559_002314 [Furculomyces boomerangus]|uniref:Ubiquitin carboxyl-terminal hydrolase n=2 Tax=Harpellales TaxID=61421 RepID=A0A2T9YW96_9FUNG|nr:hypothetical protein BB559_002314 [Furculomyces boomerangus]PWA03643.1 hypothetical protein BB558_000168 [Smittium angustum]
MDTVKIIVKWNGKKYDVDVDTTQTGEMLKLQMFSLTGVEPERQKILAKGKLIKDEDDLSKLNFTPNQIVTMMGSVGNVKGPEKPQKFIEDMTYEEITKSLDFPSGLINLGNTCYMSATLQCLLSIKELTKNLNSSSGSYQRIDSQAKLTNSLRDLFNLMNKKQGSVMPLVFLNDLRAVFPNFAQKDREHNTYRQQDAEECWSGLLTVIGDSVKSSQSEANFVNKYMSGELVTTYKCDEAPEEATTERHEPFKKLDCRIDKSVNYLQQGLKMTLVQNLKKHSPTLNRDADYTATSAISRLPMYLTLSYLRFYWKAKESINAKIVKKVKFPFELDMSEFCTKELAEKLRPARDYLRKAYDQIETEQRHSKIAKLTLTEPTSNSTENAPSESTSMDTSQDISGPVYTASGLKDVIDPSFKEDEGCNPTGLYELIAVLTHIGRNANSGHYIAWVKKESTPADSNDNGKKAEGSMWYKFDDDKVSVVKEDEIMKLEGGSDWHTAYITLYRAKEL